MKDTEVWAAVDERRRALADLLAGLTPEEWDRPSLCEAWTVREVAAHLTLAGMPRFRLYRFFLRYPGSINRTIRDASKAVARTLSNDQIRDNLRAMVGLHRPVPGLTGREALIDAVGHTLDIAVPLGREVSLPPEVVAEAADHVIASRRTPNAQVFRTLPLEGLRLIATDHDWADGTGPEVTGTMTDLFLVLTGRRAHLDRLSGLGAELLHQRLAHPA